MTVVKALNGAIHRQNPAIGDWNAGQKRQRGKREREVGEDDDEPQNVDKRSPLLKEIHQLGAPLEAGDEPHNEDEDEEDDRLQNQKQSSMRGREAFLDANPPKAKRDYHEESWLNKVVVGKHVEESLESEKSKHHAYKRGRHLEKKFVPSPARVVFLHLEDVQN